MTGAVGSTWVVCCAVMPTCPAWAYELTVVRLNCCLMPGSVAFVVKPCLTVLCCVCPYIVPGVCCEAAIVIAWVNLWVGQEIWELWFVTKHSMTWVERLTGLIVESSDLIA